jgi:IclR family acetate operon transcriptional repressor
MRLAARRGDRDPIHSTALGKAIASTLPEEHVRIILESEGMPRLTDKTITNRKSFLTELRDIEQRGFALDNGENESDGRCVAVPIPGTRLPAAISLSAPASRFPLKQVDEVARALAHTASRLAADFGVRT